MMSFLHRSALSERTNTSDSPIFSPSKAHKALDQNIRTLDAKSTVEAPAPPSLNHIEPSSKTSEHELKVEKNQGTNDETELDKTVAEIATVLSTMSMEEEEEEDEDEEDRTWCEDEESESEEESEGDNEESDELEEPVLDPPASVEEAQELIVSAFEALKADHGVHILKKKQIKFGKEIGKGAFGTVRLGLCSLGGKLVPIAIKTIVCIGKNFHERLEAFKTEARVCWQASTMARSGNSKSRVCNIYGIAYEVNEKKRGFMHLVMERIENGRDLHKELHSGKNWSDIRKDGKDTGRKIKGKYIVIETDGDVSCYTMPKSLKVHLGVEMARIAVELEKVGILHCDIKPCNILVHGLKGEKGNRSGLKLIDFGEGNTPELATGFVAGTPGYQAPEVVEDGLCTIKSEIYSIGVSLVEIWTGQVWAGAETRGEGEKGMRKEVEEALKKIQAVEPREARVIKRCIAQDPAARPSAKRLLKEMFRIKRSMQRSAGNGGGKNKPLGAKPGRISKTKNH